MDGWTIGAGIATMLTGLSVLTAAIVWTRTQWDQWQVHRAETRLRNWHGYIDVGGIDTWYVRLADDPKTPTARVVLEVIDRPGNPDEAVAYNVRLRVEQDGMLSRSPSSGELEFPTYLRKDQGYGQRNRVVRYRDLRLLDRAVRPIDPGRSPRPRPLGCRLPRIRVVHRHHETTCDEQLSVRATPEAHNGLLACSRRGVRPCPSALSINRAADHGRQTAEGVREPQLANV
jgi:hypothetical protein